ncbi:MAG: hypothetical protein ABW049_11740, partial [Spongiibacteraceae bacterium]
MYKIYVVPELDSSDDEVNLCGISSQGNRLVKKMVISTPTDETILGNAVNKFPSVMKSAWFENEADLLEF